MMKAENECQIDDCMAGLASVAFFPKILFHTRDNLQFRMATTVTKAIDDKREAF